MHPPSQFRFSRESTRNRRVGSFDALDLPPLFRPHTPRMSSRDPPPHRRSPIPSSSRRRSRSRRRSPPRRRSRSPHRNDDRDSSRPNSRQDEQDRRGGYGGERGGDRGGRDGRGGREGGGRERRRSPPPAPAGDGGWGVRGTSPGRPSLALALPSQASLAGGPEGEEGPPAIKVVEPNFAPSGALAAETNTFQGVVLKYNEPPEARKPVRSWRLYVFKGKEQVGESFPQGGGERGS